MKDYVSFKKLIENRWDFVSICNLFPPQGGGLENAAYQLLHFLCKEKKLSCLAFFSGDKNKYYNKDGIDCVELGNFKLFHGFYPIVGLSYIIKLTKVLRLNRNAIFIIYGRHFTGSIVASLLCKMYKVDYLYIDTGFEANVSKSKIINFVLNLLDRTLFSLCYKFAKKHVIVSETSKQFIRVRYGQRVDEAKVILNGFEENIIRMYDGWRKEKIMVFASRLVNVKNPNIVASAYLDLAPRYKDWQFYLIGKGECLFNHLDKEEIPSNVHFINELISQNDFHKLLSKAAIYINSSFSEGLPLSVVEAAALGCILVMSNIKHNMEVAKVSNLERYSFPARDLNFLIQKLEQAMNDSMKNGQKYHEHIAEKNYKVFANTKIFAQYWELFKQF